ncbi:DUF3253 domain-containing protein [Arthrobacter gengyunqii]|uniref:DUF3253 domain-containing protein n=1 Tax=Arthrobacter gengyunqii TaxID=2886940 RepID=A0ABS8GJI8_9MICC|nr:DUF3253 domain-containing protein [Arthrobacter gengyunqii]MCC3266785.1 DUF3253 domain-containing protein [Arthrobacter gengyunqii]
MDNSETVAAGNTDAWQDDVGPRLEAAILGLLAARADTATICPSDAARTVAPDNWRPLMDEARGAAGRLVASGDVDITQRGEVVDLSSVRGPIRIRRRR